MLDLHRKIEEQDAQITTDPLPVVEGNRGQLEQVLMNLIDNAIKYSGDEPACIHVSAECEDEICEIAVRDEGIGIEPGVTDRVIEAFTGHIPTTRIPGPGSDWHSVIGLSNAIVATYGSSPSRTKGRRSPSPSRRRRACQFGSFEIADPAKTLHALASYEFGMSVILEFTIDNESFQLGEALAPPPHMQIELERVVPTGAMVMPFLWATGDETDEFEASVRQHSGVKELEVIDSIGDRTLYRIEWEGQPTDLLKAIAETEAVVLEARRNRLWMFRLRFPNHEKLSKFHKFIIEQGVSLNITRTYTLSETTEQGHRFGLTEEQREALVLALRQGYFASPSEVSLESLADELDISRQAVSKRIRRGNEAVLRKVLLSESSEPE